MLTDMNVYIYPALIMSQPTLDINGNAVRHESGPDAPPPTRRWALAIHGGAGAISRQFDPERLDYLSALRVALDAGAKILREGGSSVRAAVEAVRAMEECPLFNAGIGSVLTAEGTHEMDAAVMRGSDMQCGSVAAVKCIRNPVVLAECVLERSPHVLLVGEGAEQFASVMGFERVDNHTFTTPARLKIHQQLLAQAQMKANAAAEQRGRSEMTMPIGSPTGRSLASVTATPQPPVFIKPILDHTSESVTLHGDKDSSELAHDAAKATAEEVECIPTAAPSSSSAASSSSSSWSSPPTDGDPRFGDKKYGTVGAVALDLSGNLATAISTGGMSLKSFGRVGDSACIGAGFYASRDVAVACTGNGEAFLRSCVAKDVACLMEYRGLNVEQAAAQAMRNGEERIGNEFEGGLIAMDKDGNISMPFNSRGMYRGSISDREEAFVAVWRD